MSVQQNILAGRKRPLQILLKAKVGEPPNKQPCQTRKVQKDPKQDLLTALANIEKELCTMDQAAGLRQLFDDLRAQVKTVVENHDEEMQRLRNEVEDLRKQVEMTKAEIKKLSDENSQLRDSLAIGQATWVWEAHLARFVVNPAKKISKFARFRQMEKYLDGGLDASRWAIIQEKIGGWKESHWEVIRAIRDERNSIAHPDFLDFDKIQEQIEETNSDFQEPMRNMVDMLKMTASLMKFGRLAVYYDSNKNLYPAMKPSAYGKGALKVIKSWDRKFEEIDGLVHIEHEEAKGYMEEYVQIVGTAKQYNAVVDDIKKENSKRLGKLAWEFAATSTEQSEALNELKKLLPNPAAEPTVKALDYAIARLHVPDFLPKPLWREGIKIVDFFNPPKQ